ncbi:hypothetical protein ATANTOWER_007600 [Ataeniobius toweri]|uniref:Uncharacterized protein n=1 Tax=Ataeniobius toweri TaxID=208326 RepID=A0ABU7A4Y2_9TELE|nr:hypothetical protein [Ataeniobius toweri]
MFRQIITWTRALPQLADHAHFSFLLCHLEATSASTTTPPTTSALATLVPTISAPTTSVPTPFLPALQLYPASS